MRACLIVSALMIAANITTASDTATIEGVLTAGDTGNRINWGFVFLHDYTSDPSEPEYTSKNMEVRTGRDGHFAFKVDGGCYDLFVSALWFAPRSERICVQKGQTTKLKLRMKPDRRTNLRID